MEKCKLVDLLCELCVEGPTDSRNLLDGFNENKYKEFCHRLDCTEEDVGASLKNMFELYFSSKVNADWRYIHLSLYVLNLLNTELETQEEILSVQQSKCVKSCLKNLVKIGICTKLQPNLPFYIKSGSDNSSDIFLHYNILKCTVFGLSELLKFPNLRILILPDGLKAILAGAYQICYCPLKKPSSGSVDSGMTDEIYQKLLNERELFFKLLNHLRETIHSKIFVKETMVLFQANAPAWFKKNVAKSLTNIIRSKNGVETIAVALLDGVVTDDSSQTWKILEVFSKLIISCKNFLGFEDNICRQLVAMLDKVTDDALVFERVFAHCTKSLYHVEQRIADNIFIKKIISFFLNFVGKDHKFDDGEVLTRNITQIVRISRAVFVENSVDAPSVPLIRLRPVISVIFRLYAVTANTSFTSTNNELQDILTHFLSIHSVDSFALFDSFLFELNTDDIMTFRNDIVLKVEAENIVINYSNHAVSYSTAEDSEFLLKVLKTKPHFMVNFFGYLLNCLTNRDKYFKKANQVLLNLEVDFMSEYFERRLTVYKLLSDLAEDKTVQKHVTENPEDVIKYINNVLEKTAETCTHKTTDFETEDFQSVFTIIMILQVLVSNSSASKLENYNILMHPLKVIMRETLNSELENLVKNILDVLENKKCNKKVDVDIVKTELDKAIEDICDPLLPVRGHGLMTLMKLVEKKDKRVMERKQYILNIFQQNLKNEDSFIYLSAIGGLAAMGDVFSDTVLNILCEEYSECSRKSDDGHEVRMKLGEALLRVTKTLGEMAPKYKPLLLNTFLSGAKDEDPLIRASNLSNLGEVCRVLGYKLGTIVTEVLVCVHAVIATDKSLEARRAAVTVIRQLFVGLDNEMIAFLKDDILPIYRTLKEIYNNDKDDVMRLQAQLALEELNENMRKFVFPKPQLNTEKKIFLLN